jgi:hypothetical protein
MRLNVLVILSRSVQVQGYAILIERTLVNENTLELRISDIHKILTVEYDKSDGERRECLGRGLHQQKEVLGSIHSANKDNKTDAELLSLLLSFLLLSRHLCMGKDVLKSHNID